MFRGGNVGDSLVVELLGCFEAPPPPSGPELSEPS